MTGKRKSGSYMGWNFAVLLMVIAAPILLVFIEYLRRKDMCAPAEHCHAFEFIAPTVSAAALALVLPGMSWPAPIKEIHQTPPKPRFQLFHPFQSRVERQKWATENAEALKKNWWTRFFWRGKALFAILSGVFAIATFVAWGLILDPHEGANIPNEWTRLQTTTSVLYGFAMILTAVKTGLEWYSND